MITPTLSDSNTNDLQEEERAWLVPSEALDRFVPPDVVARDHEGQQKTNVRYGYQLGLMNFLVGEKMVSEVLDRPKIYSVPKSTEYLRGIINLRGNVVPVFDLRAVLQTEGYELAVDSNHQETTQSVIVLGKGTDAAGLVINKLPKTVEVVDQIKNDDTETKNIASCPAIIQEFVDHAFVSSGIEWMEFDYQGFLKNLAIESKQKKIAYQTIQ